MQNASSKLNPDRVKESIKNNKRQNIDKKDNKLFDALIFRIGE